MVACASGDLGKVEQMLAEGVDPNQVTDLGGTPLTWAVAWGREDVVECLLHNGADVELPGRPAWSPLMHAASRGNRAIVSLLIAHGADARRKDQKGQLPVDVAIESGHVRCALLIELLAMPGAAPVSCSSRPRRSPRGRALRRVLRSRRGPPS
jgi:ankyrin repeat protein